MRREIIETGKTVEDAIDSACAKLGLERESVEWEIIDLPKKGFLGLKNLPARVRVWKETLEEERPAPPAPAKSGISKAPPPKAAEGAVQVKKEATAPISPVTAPVKAPSPEKPGEASGKPRNTSSFGSEKNLVMNDEIAEKIQVATDYLAGVCKKMGIAPTFRSELKDGGVCINVEGDGLGVIIGRRGETLDALQYLCGLVGNRRDGDYLRFTLDCGDYRVKRKLTLEALAKKLSAQVLKTKTSKTLEPMNPFERRIIHATISEIDGVSSTSIGDEPNRRVVINLGNGQQGSRFGGGRDSRGGDRRGGGRSRRGAPPRREIRHSTQGGTINTLPQTAAPVPSPSPAGRQEAAADIFNPVPAPKLKPVEKPKETMEASASDKPLYAKLDLE